ncbi:hypothetical protein AB0N05_00750 [Nocardia sp. NPDC051030]|uniref:hypothetical protein n=1 Tax=Nocardia sp. NPDC051030 TaxID=3155162 RepID=UPI003412DA97
MMKDVAARVDGDMVVAHLADDVISAWKRLRLLWLQGRRKGARESSVVPRSPSANDLLDSLIAATWRGPR